jgi:ABC-type Fe3+-citrate transport system substrate-binding protein
MDISAVPTIELMNCQNTFQGNIQFNRAILNDLTKTKSILKGYDQDNQRVNSLIAQLDQDQAMFNKCVDELNKRAQAVFDYDLNILKFDKLREEVAEKFLEASNIYLEEQKKKAVSEEGVMQMNAKGEA